MQVAGPMKNTQSFLKLYNFLVKTGIKFTNMLVLEVALKLAHMPKNTSINSWREEQKRLKKSSSFWPVKTLSWRESRMNLLLTIVLSKHPMLIRVVSKCLHSPRRIANLLRYNMQLYVCKLIRHQFKLLVPKKWT